MVRDLLGNCSKLSQNGFYQRRMEGMGNGQILGLDAFRFQLLHNVF